MVFITNYFMLQDEANFFYLLAKQMTEKKKKTQKLKEFSKCHRLFLSLFQPKILKRLKQDVKDNSSHTAVCRKNFS